MQRVEKEARVLQALGDAQKSLDAVAFATAHRNQAENHRVPWSSAQRAQAHWGPMNARTHLSRRCFWTQAWVSAAPCWWSGAKPPGVNSERSFYAPHDPLDREGLRVNPISLVFQTRSSLRRLRYLSKVTLLTNVKPDSNPGQPGLDVTTVPLAKVAGSLEPGPGQRKYCQPLASAGSAA